MTTYRITLGQFTESTETNSYERIDVTAESEADALAIAADQWQQEHGESGDWIAHHGHTVPDGDSYWFVDNIAELRQGLNGSLIETYNVSGGRCENYDFYGSLTIDELRPLGERLNTRNNAGIDLTLPDDELASAIIGALHSWGEESDETDRLQVSRGVLLS